jgi:hypothetical protein
VRLLRRTPLRARRPYNPPRRQDPLREIRGYIVARDRTCLGPRVGMPGQCWGMAEIDHVRASGGLGIKSPSTADNLVLLCSVHHQVRTLDGKRWRPLLLEYLAQVEAA